MIDSLLAFLFPERCHGCKLPGTALCANCLRTIPQAPVIDDPAYAIALFDYHDPIVRDAVWQLKYHRKSSVAKALVLHAAPDIAAHFALLTATSKQLSSICLVPIPQHYTKTFSRGFNQSMLIARWIRTVLPEASILSLLKKNRANDSQAHASSKKDRERNIAHSMQARDKYQKLDPHALYIVVDDVITTGSTIRETSRALRAAGARNICAVALAHGYASKSALTFRIS